MIKLMVGLSNPKEKYYNTRHNVGSWFIKKLSLLNKNIIFKENKRFLGYKTKFFINKTLIYLFIPNIFMNINGIAVKKIKNFYNIKTKNILIVHDELNLPPGVAKFKLGSKLDTHLGVKSISREIKNSNFFRLRIGIGRPILKNSSIANFVLSIPNIYEKNLINLAIEKSIKCTKIFIKKNIYIAMNVLHNS